MWHHFFFLRKRNDVTIDCYWLTITKLSQIVTFGLSIYVVTFELLPYCLFSNAEVQRVKVSGKCGKDWAFVDLNCWVLVVCLSVCSWKLFSFFAIIIPICWLFNVCFHFNNKYRYWKHWCLEKVPSWLSVKGSYTGWPQSSGQLDSLHFLLRTQSCPPIIKLLFSTQVFKVFSPLLLLVFHRGP